MGIIAKLREFPGLGEHGAGLLQLAEEGLGIKASTLELKTIGPMLMDLQKNVHEHYSEAQIGAAFVGVAAAAAASFALSQSEC